MRRRSLLVAGTITYTDIDAQGDAFTYCLDRSG
jgi:hypothetical protein